MKTILPSLENCTIAVIGLGYVGLPLALEFAKNQSVVLPVIPPPSSDWF